MATRRSDTDGGIGLPTPVVEDLLEDDTRRRALAILAERDEPVVVGSLAAAVVARREDGEVAAVSDDDREAVRAELYREHLPKLTATDVVTYDSMVGTVELTAPELLDGDRLTEFR